MDNSLNYLQKQVVETTERPVVVIAGPGTGKTKTLVAKLVYLLSSMKVPADQIVALTFTRKAASELYKRLKLQLRYTELPIISTFHGLAMKKLEETEMKVNIISDEDRSEILKQLIEKNEFKSIESLSLREVELQLSKLKNNATTIVDPIFEQLLKRYQEQLQQRGLMDYDDLLIQYLEHLQKSAVGIFKYVLVDEFQDTNQIQYQIIQQIAQPTGITIIGDPKQAIYGFRGASSSIFDQFQSDYPSAQTIELVDHYRSTPQIVSLSHSLFPLSPVLKPANHTIGDTKIVHTLDRHSEADWIMRDIMNKTGGSDLLEASDVAQQYRGNLQYSQIAVLYRTHSVRRSIEQRLRAAGLPLQVSGAESFWQDKLVQFFIQFISAKSEISDKTNERLRKSPYWNNNLKQFFESDWSPLLLIEVLEKVGNDGEAWQSLVAELYHFNDQKEWLKLVTSHYEKLKAQDFHDPQAQKISLLTMHGAKGLEFEVVYICSCVDDVIPHRRFHADESSIEEEKRLFYVAVTRAKKYLYLLTNDGVKKINKPSRFIKILEDAGLGSQKDDHLEKIVRKREKAKLKKNQMSLF